MYAGMRGGGKSGAIYMFVLRYDGYVDVCEKGALARAIALIPNPSPAQP